eukprot:GHRQ01012425.1.p1 GENE.GHRQ01012425.1~~GHRQ01012425.1.p1  ORF type:complete len:260 (+),score=89.85 GHRQ01012425.1:919-1698(+)
MCLKPTRASPLCLLQEAYHDPWMHITCCVLCSRTSGSATVRCCIARFFEAFPSPTACLQGCPDAMASLLHPLGLSQARLPAVRAVAQGFLGTDWQEPSEFRGCGKFVTDSWRIFCKGPQTATGVADAKLRHYMAWALRQQQPGSGQAGAGQPAAEQAPAARSSGKRRRRDTGTAEARRDTGDQQAQKHAGSPTAQRRTRAQAREIEAGCAASAAAALERGIKRASITTSKRAMYSRGGMPCNKRDVKRGAERRTRSVVR